MGKSLSNGTAKKRALVLGRADRSVGHRVILYGPGGIGKTTLCDSLPGPVASFDLDDSLGILDLPNTQKVEGIATWEDLRCTLHGDGWEEVKSVVIDTATNAEELAHAWVIGNVAHEKGHRVQRLEDYGYGKGYQHLYDTFVRLLGDLELHTRAGRHVVLCCHDCTTTVPNPQGEDWLRYEPRLQSPSSGKASIRLRVREWADHVLFMGYDVDVTEDGKGIGSGTRTLWPVERPHCMAKSRRLAQPLALTGSGEDVWARVFGLEEKEGE